MIEFLCNEIMIKNSFIELFRKKVELVKFLFEKDEKFKMEKKLYLQKLEIDIL